MAKVGRKKSNYDFIVRSYVVTKKVDEYLEAQTDKQKVTSKSEVLRNIVNEHMGS